MSTEIVAGAVLNKATNELESHEGKKHDSISAQVLRMSNK